MRVNKRAGKEGPKWKFYSFSIGFESLSTMFPQLWITENKPKRGENVEDEINIHRSS